MTQDQVFVPPTRSDRGLPPLDPTREDRLGSRVTEEVKKEMREALGDSPIGTIIGSASYLVCLFFIHVGKTYSYKAFRSLGDGRRTSLGMLPARGDTHRVLAVRFFSYHCIRNFHRLSFVDFNPSAPMFAPHHYHQIILSAVGVLLWFMGLGFGMYKWGFLTVFKTYLVPYLWVNHWLVLITFLQHTDPLLPHYRGSEFTFARGALATLDRNVLGDLGSLMGWIGAHATHGISETHILHHVSSKIPHYNA
jgi:omega-6 fatty acid desaturase (delta-12 desaturase)